MGKSITSANAVITLTITGLYPQPQTLQQFTADDVFGVDDVEPTETELSVDGILSGGRIPTVTNQSFMFNPSSLSCKIFDDWKRTQDQVGDVLTAEGRTLLKSIGTKYVMTRGFLVSWTPMAPAGKVLKSRKAIVRWQNVVPNVS